MTQELIATVGSNPLPVVVSALTRKATRLHLVMTPQVEPLGERIWSLLEANERAKEGKHTAARGQRVILSDDASSDVTQLRADLSQSSLPWSTADLDYTGGTKLVATEVHAYWRKQNPAGKSSYLTERGKLVWGLPPGKPGAPWSPPEASLSFSELSRLHFERPLRSGDRHRIEQLGEAADRILAHVRSEGFSGWKKLLPDFRPSEIEKDGLIYKEANALLAKNVRDPEPSAVPPIKSLLPLSPPALEIIGLGSTIDEVAQTIGASGAKKEKRIEVLKWLEGGWLELAATRLLERTQLFDEVHQDIKQDGKASGDNFQVDVVAVKGHRAYLFTCTTMDSAAQCKHKLFEGVHRAARLGGEYARVALVSLMPRPEEVIQNVREDGWEGYDQFRSFGLPHLCEGTAPTFVDAHGQAGPSQTWTDALTAWLEG